MKELAILGVVLSYILLIVSQHLLNWVYRNKNEDFPIALVIFGQVISLTLFYGLTMKVIEVF
jgi:hypothetical protein